MKTDRAKVGDFFLFLYKEERDFDCLLQVVHVNGEGPEDFVFWEDGSHTKQKHVPNLHLVRRSTKRP